ncbi:sialidase family protein [soil metagenome]
MKTMKRNVTLLVCLLAGWFTGLAQTVPGDIVCYEPSSSLKYIGSPSLVTLPNGDYVASHDFFGPKSSEWQQAVTRVYSSKNKGKTWRYLTEINGAFWSSLFVHRGELYLLGPDRHHGTVLIRKSTDGGNTWTKPTNKENGVLLTGEFHCAPMPVIEYNRRLWRPMETAHGPVLQWGKRYGAMVMSAPVDADLMDSKSWQTSTPMLYDSTFNNGDFGGWLEGNFVVDKNQRMWDMLRVANKKSPDEKAAMVSIAPDGKTLSFDPASGFIPFDGGSKKFVIKYDTLSKKYWTLANVIPDKYRRQFPDRNASGFRNILMLKSSDDLKKWDEVKVILEHDDVLNHGFQYVDWSFEGSDMIVLSRTAYFDGSSNAKNNHDANYLTFHRIENFRKLKNGK